MAKDEDKVIKMDHVSEGDGKDEGNLNNTIQNNGAQSLDNVRQFKLNGFFNFPQYPRAFAESLSSGMKGSSYYDTTNNVIRVNINGTWKTVTAV